jgi:DNA invertase Pin-like site-specific DNA recombinase
MNIKAVCYYRVSTNKQGVSGLGLDAQKASAKQYCDAGSIKIIKEYSEVQSGGKNDREMIRQALEYCEITKAILVVAKLDRISRDVGFIDTLLKSGVKFVCADMPEANESMIQFMSVFAQYERKMSSERTKAALATKKTQAEKRGESAGLGNPDMKAMRSKIPSNFRQKGTLAKKKKATAWAAKIMPSIEEAQNKGCTSLRQIADWLNKNHIEASKGGKFQAVSVKRILDTQINSGPLQT